MLKIINCRGALRGSAIIFTLFLFIIVSGPAYANSIQFSGLGQVNKSIVVYDINSIANNNPSGLIATINDSSNFYYTPGDSYDFEIDSPNNTTFLSNGLDWMNFVFSTRGELLITAIVLSIFLFLFLGGAFLLLRRRR